MNGDLTLDPNLDVWYGEITYEYADEDCDDPNLRRKSRPVKMKTGRKKVAFVILNPA